MCAYVRACVYVCVCVSIIGLSIGHNISMAVFGGTAPIVATALMRHTSDLASPAAMMIVAAVLSIAGVWSARRYFAVP